MKSVTLYGRDGCHLCDEARAALVSLREDGARFSLDEIDIDTDDALHAAFLERIPVVQVDGEIVAELVCEPARLRVALGLDGA